MDSWNNCTVHALSAALNIEKEAAYQMLKKAGRRDNRPFGLSAWLKKQPFVKKRITDPQQSGGQAVVKAYPKGRYILRVRKHALALVDGQIIDSQPRKRYHIKEIIRVEPVSNKPTIQVQRIPFSAMIPSPCWQ